MCVYGEGNVYMYVYGDGLAKERTLQFENALFSVDDVDGSVRQHFPNVSRVEPPVLDHFARFFFVFEIPDDRIRAVDDDLSPRVWLAREKFGDRY